jgi:hypothetical protein
LALTLAITLPVSAAEKKGRAAPKPFDPAASVLKRLEKAELTADQTAKIKEICGKYCEKLQAAEQKVNLTAEQKTARAEAQKKAQAEGKKGKELQAAVDAAMKLTDEQKAAVKDAQAIRAEMTKEAFAVLTDDQKAKAGVAGPRGKRK